MSDLPKNAPGRWTLLLGGWREAACAQTALIQALWVAAAFAWAVAFGLLGFFANLKDQPSPAREYRAAQGALVGDHPLPGQTGKAVFAYVTGYNTVLGQTSTHPCIAASGADICHQRSAVACPRKFRFGTVVEIKGRPYTCEDHTAVKYGSRFDINCDKNESCPHDVAGWAIVKILTASSPQMLAPYGTADLI